MAGLPVQTLTRSRGIATSPRLALALLLSLVALPTARGQQRAEIHVDVTATALDEALRAFATATGTALAFDPELVRGIRVTCSIRTRDAEAYLGCLLADTGLEFFRRSSGTYVIASTLALPPRYGIISGRVMEADSELPLPRAHVTIQGRRRGGQKGTVSSTFGNFALADLLPGRYRLAISHVGYHTWADSIDVLAGLPTVVGPRLVPRVFSTAPVVVEQTATSLFPLDRPQDLSPGRSVATGVPTGSFADLTAGFHIQGADEGHLQVRLDGHPVYLPRQLLGVIGPFSGGAIQSVVEERAGFGAAGGSLLGGALDFRQELSRENGAAIQANRYALETTLDAFLPGARHNDTRGRFAARTSLTGRSAPATLQKTLDSWARTDPFLLVAPVGQYESATEGHLASLLDLVDASPSIDFSDIHVVAEHDRPDGSTVGASLFWASRGISGDRRRSLAERNLQASSPLLSSAASHDWKTLTSSLSWRKVIGFRTFVRADARASRYRYRHDYSLAEISTSDTALAPQGPDSIIFLDQGPGDGNRLTEGQFTIQVDHARSNHTLSGGVELIRTASDFNLRLASVDSGGVAVVTTTPDPVSIFLARHGTVQTSSASFRPVIWAADRVEWDQVALDGSMRLTFLPGRRTVYAEPRLRAAWKPHPSLVVAASSGVYRQFVNQFDYSTLNAGELVPSTRFWLPSDESIRPARALHAALDAEWRPAPDWRATLSLYGKRVSDSPALQYALDPLLLFGTEALSEAQLLIRQDLRHIGFRLAVERAGPRHRTRLRYDRARDRQQSSEQFGGRWLPTPWNVPHRVVAEQEFAASGWALRGSLTLEKGMRWALRQAYYDYFGSRTSGFQHLGWDLSNPEAHRLPARFTLDLGGRWQPVPEVVLLAEALNVLDRRNQLDQRLLWDGAALSPDARYLPGRSVVLSATLTL